MKQKPFKVETLEHLWILAQNKKAVTCEHFTGQRMPAAFVMSMQGNAIRMFIKAGLYLYEPKPKTKAPFAKGGDA